MTRIKHDVVKSAETRASSGKKNFSVVGILLKSYLIFAPGHSDFFHIIT
jgi:hypothetical protein